MKSGVLITIDLKFKFSSSKLLFFIQRNYFVINKVNQKNNNKY